MKIFAIFALLILVTPQLLGEDPRPSQVIPFKVGDQTYKFTVPRITDKRLQWNFQASDNLPVSLRQAYQKAQAALYSLRSPTEEWETTSMHLSFTLTTASYEINFVLKDPKTKKPFILPFQVFMDGSVNAPVLKGSTAEQGAAANP